MTDAEPTDLDKLRDELAAKYQDPFFDLRRAFKAGFDAAVKAISDEHLKRIVETSKLDMRIKTDIAEGASKDVRGIFTEPK